MGTGSEAFGWCRSHERDNVSGSAFTIQGLGDAPYAITWYDAWTGDVIISTTQKVRNRNLLLEVPEMVTAHPDIAFKIRRK
jgi:hypothetical protein